MYYEFLVVVFECYFVFVDFVVFWVENVVVVLVVVVFFYCFDDCYVFDELIFVFVCVCGVVVIGCIVCVEVFDDFIC